MTTDVTGGSIPQELTARYRLGEARTSNPISALYPGRDLKTDAPVMVKLLRTSAISAVSERQRIRREFLKLAPIRHPNLCPVLAAGENDDLLWMVRPALPGQSAMELLAQGRRFTPAEAAWVGARAAGALAELHKQGILHRDLRPGHVLLGPDGAVHVLDGALGRLFRNDEGRVVAGQPGYAAPEAIQGKLVSFRSDLYSLGALVFELTTGGPVYGPAGAPDVLRRQCEVDAPGLPESAPTALARLVASLLARDPRERPFSAQQLERQFEPLAQAPTVTAVLPPGLPQAGQEAAPAQAPTSPPVVVAPAVAVTPAAPAGSSAVASAQPTDGVADDDDFAIPLEVGAGTLAQDFAHPAAQPTVTSRPSVPTSNSKVPPPPPAAALLKGAGSRPHPPVTSVASVPTERAVSDLDALAELVVVPAAPAPPAPLLSPAMQGPALVAIPSAPAAPLAPPKANGHAMPEVPMAVVPFDDDPEAPTRVSSVQELGASMAQAASEPGPAAGSWGPKIPTVPPLPAGAPVRGTLPGVIPIPPASRVSHPTLLGYSNGAALDAAAVAASAASVVNQAPASAPPVAAPVSGPPVATAEHSGNVALPTRREPLDYDDMMDTVVNEDSRVFGSPLEGVGALGGTAVPPLPSDIAQQVITGGAIPAPAPSPGIPGPQGWGAPGAYHPSQPAVPAPLPATASMPPGAYPSVPHGQYTMPPGYAPQGWPPAAPPRKGVGVLPVILLGGMAFGMISMAGIGSYFYARHRAQAAQAASPPTLTVVPPTPVTLPGTTAEAQPTPPSPPSQVQPTPSQAQAPPPTPSAIPAPGASRPPAPQVAVAPTAPREPPGRSHGGSVIHVRDPQGGAHTSPPPAPTPTPVAVAPPPARPTPPAAPVGPARPAAPAAAPIPQGPPEQMFAEAIRRRDWAQARGFAANMVRANPNSAPAHARLADMMERTGDSRAALNEYRASLRLDPRNAGYLHRLAALQQSTGDRAGAIQSFRQILAINPGDQGAQARLRALGVSP